MNYEYWIRYPLHAVTSKGNIEIMKKHLKNGCSVNERDNVGRTVLHTSIKYIEDPEQLYEVCKMLLENGANPNIVDDYRDTSLHYLLNLRIVGKGEDNIKLLDLFIRKNADVNSKNSRGKSPLSIAVFSNNVKVVRKILESGTNLNTESKKNLLISAICNNDRKIMLYLMKRGANINNWEMILLFLWIDKKECFELFTDYSGELDEKNSIDHPWESDTEALTMLFKTAVTGGLSNALEILLENGLDMNLFKVDDPNEKVFCSLSYVYFHYCENSHSLRVPKYRNMMLTVLKHFAIMLQSKDIEVKEQTLHFIRENSYIRPRLEKYINEVKLMKNTYINKNLNITYFDFLIKRQKSLWNCCTEELVSEISEDKVNVMFPIFAEKLLRIIRKIISQRTARDNFRQMLTEILEPKLPNELIYYICNLLKMKDIIRFRLQSVEL